MNLLQRLFSKPPPIQILAATLPGTGNFEIEVESLSTKNLDLLWKATSNQWQHDAENEDFYERRTDATLMTDPESRVPHAVCVKIAGKVAGRLPNAEALKLHRQLKALGYDQIDAACKANVVGRTGFWHVHIDLDTALPGIKAATDSSR